MDKNKKIIDLELHQFLPYGDTTCPYCGKSSEVKVGDDFDEETQSFKCYRCVQEFIVPWDEIKSIQKLLAKGYELPDPDI